jgi:sugar phosphate isomerase/epimerase
MSLRLTMSTDVSSAAALDVEATLSLASELGYRAVELTPTTLGGSRLECIPPSVTELEAVARHLERFGLAAPAANLWYLPVAGVWAEEHRFFPPGISLPRADPERYVRYITSLVDRASDLGLEVINVFSFPFIGSTVTDTITRFVESVGPLCERARLQNVRLCLEVEPCCRVAGSERGVDTLLREIADPVFGLTFDTANFFAAEIEPFPYGYEKFRERIYHVHLRNACEYRPEDPADECYFPFPSSPDERPTFCRFTEMKGGAINVAGLLERLVRDEFAGSVCIQPLALNPRKLERFLGEDLRFTERVLRGLS